MRTGRLTLVALLALLLSGCTPTTTQTEDPNAPVTLSFWHGWSLPNDLAALQTNIDRFTAAHPNVTVNLTPNVSDDKILQGLRSSTGPDVVSSFTTDAVGALCGGALIDLNPLLKRDNLSPSAFVPARIAYTQYQGTQCTLPLLGDAFGLYYNTDMFAAAGITAPPKTWSEFTADAVKLTKATGGGFDPVGFMPSFEGYESQPSVWMTQWSPTWLDKDGRSNLANDPKVAEFFTYTKSLVEALGGYDALNSYRTTFGEEFSAENAFEAKKVAMQIDGEWRIANIRDDGVDVKYAVAPLPVPDDQAANYGMGYLTGTVAGISARSAHQQAAWELVKFLTTDTDALVSFANAIKNVPSTEASLASPALEQDPNFAVFLDISKNPASVGIPASGNGGAYQTILNRFAADWESGTVPDLHAGLVVVDQEIDAANAQSSR
jgi:multiple sugar transport system substrate-binding protein